MNWTNTALNTAHIYENVMELLVQEEIEKQLKSYPKQIKLSLNKVEIEAYALNRLPALYASSEKGKEMQKQLGQQKYQKQISLAVRRSLAMIEQNPCTKSRSLISVSEIETKYQEAQKTLQKLQQLLAQNQLLENLSTELTWDNLVSRVKQALIKRYWQNNSKNSELQLQAQRIDNEFSLGWDSDFIS